MPEIKNNFTQGKMNKDFDERLIPNGQYIDALNIEVSTSEGSDVGTVKNIIGNKQIDDFIPTGFRCVGSIADEKSNKLYWLISSYNKDAILEHDAENNVTIPVIVDLKAGTSKAVLKFSGKPITGINIINDLLFWTDGESEPKKININSCIEGTPDFDTHTQLVFPNGSFNGITLNYTSPSSTNANYWPPNTLPSKGRYFWFEANQMNALLNRNLNPAGSSTFPGVNGDQIRHYRDGEFLGLKGIVIWTEDAAVSLYNSNPTNGTHARTTPYGDGWNQEYQRGDVIFGNDVRVDIQERHITVVKIKPLTAPAIKINYDNNVDSPTNIPNLFETKFPRFSYRYKYRDGEFSAFAPFTQPVFNPKYIKDTGSADAASVPVFNKDTAYTIKEPHNKAMINSIHSVELTDFVTQDMPEDVSEIDILYKQEDSNVIYSIGTIKHIDPEWHRSSNHEDYEIGVGQAEAGRDFTFHANGGIVKGKYVVTTENIYAALPANQILRPWDNVPRKALAQEITGNRIVYANYLQNYNIGVSKAQIFSDFITRYNNKSFEDGGLPSVKSQRNYQVGIVYCDKYGRETPIFTDQEAAINIPWETNGMKNASRSTQITADVVKNFPVWADSIKFFIKESSKEYYNLVMDKAYQPIITNEIDNEEDHIWISFPSSDRNKIKEEDYLILKKKVGVGEKQIFFENKFKILDIKNEAPDSIKYRMMNLGTRVNDSNDILTTDLFQNSTKKIDVETDMIHIHSENWYDVASNGIPIHTGDPEGTNGKVKIEDLYMSWSKNDSGNISHSKKYRITEARIAASTYQLKLSQAISKTDADLAHTNGDSTSSLATLNQNITFRIEKKDLKDKEKFSGRFFVKIATNKAVDEIISGSQLDELSNYNISSKIPSYYWQDEKGTNANYNHQSYGLFNYDGFNAVYSTSSNKVSSINNSTTPVTDTAAAWNAILTNYPNGTFFIDSMYMCAGQSTFSDYAKYCCITWSSVTPGGKGVVGTYKYSIFTYPPVKYWYTDWLKEKYVAGAPDGVKPFVAELLEGTTGYPRRSFSPVLIKSDAEESDSGNETGEADDIPKDTKVYDGWIGPSQMITRHEKNTYTGPEMSSMYVNGLEGIITTTDKHVNGPRRWVEGTSHNNWNTGVDTKTYGNTPGKHFMHLSFFAPGADLHNGNFIQPLELFGTSAVGNQLQGIWGGGHFNPGGAGVRVGTDSTFENKHESINLEGNYDETTGEYLSDAPGPGVGFGYDIVYRKEHENQWNPWYREGGVIDEDIRYFVSNLVQGNKFKFSTDDSANPTVYTIKSVKIKKLYNHTSWRRAINRWNGYKWKGSVTNPNGQDAFKSVEEAGIEWLKTLDADGLNTGNTNTAEETLFQDKIEQFGKAHNRRICYILELDKNPTVQSHNPLQADGNYADANSFANIEFITPYKQILIGELDKFPAIWETDAKKIDVDLDIYYEASNHIPIKINDKTNELFAPIGCKVEPYGWTNENDNDEGFSHLIEWSGRDAIMKPGFDYGDSTGQEYDYSYRKFKFLREDGSYIIGTTDNVGFTGITTGKRTSFRFREDIGTSIQVGLAWYNCFSFGNGIESDRIRDDFNQMFIGTGVKASTILQQTYREEYREHGLIYSGLYNSNSGINDLNQFIMAEKITKDLNPTYGSIQKLFSRRISLIAFCEDRVVGITANKDALFNADGDSQLVSTNRVLGEANPFVGEFGISKNPESFAKESYRAYFTDKQRGAVLRLSKDGLTPISDAGMNDWFRDNLKNYSALIGTYDIYKRDYNITLTHREGESLIYNTFFTEGVPLTTLQGNLENYITNPIVENGNSLILAWEEPGLDIESTDVSNPFEWGPSDQTMFHTTTITNHAPIAVGEIVPEQINVGGQAAIPATPGNFNNSDLQGFNTANYDLNLGISGTTSTGGTTSFSFDTDSALYFSLDGQVSTYPVSISTWGGTTNSISNNFWFGEYSSMGADYRFGALTALLGMNIQRYIDGNIINEYDQTEYYTANSHSGNPTPPPTHPPNLRNFDGDYMNPTWPMYDTSFNNTAGSWNETPFISETITHNKKSSTALRGVVFDRVPASSAHSNYIVANWANQPNPIGITSTGGLNWKINDDPAYANIGVTHQTVLAGEELYIEVIFSNFVSDFTDGGHNYMTGSSPGTNSGNGFGWNIIKPKISLLDGGTLIDSSKIFDITTDVVPGSTDPYESIISFPGADTSSWPYMGQSYFSSNNDWVPDTKLNQSSLGSIAGLAQNHMHMKGFVDSAAVSFPLTTDIKPSWANNGATSTAPSYEDGELVWRCGFMIKFKNPDNPIGGTDPTYSGNEGVVVDDLRIKISQTASTLPALSGSYDNADIDPFNSRYPLWTIKNIRVQKLQGIVSSEVPGQVAIAGTDYGPHPAVAIPGWVEVNHSNGDNWNLFTSYGVSNSAFQNTNIYGPDYGGTTQSGTASDGTTKTWLEPETPTGNPNVTYPEGGFADGVAEVISQPGYLEIQIDDGSGGPNGKDNLSFDITSDPWVVGEWYLCDIEYDDSFNSGTGFGTGDGKVWIDGVAPADASTFVSGGVIDPEGIGVYRGNSGYAHVGLKPITRTEYGTTKDVLRAIFQVASNSARAQGTSGATLNSFRLSFFNFQNAARIEKIIVKKLDVPEYSDGSATNWNHSSDSLTHSFSPRRTYFKKGISGPGKLCFNIDPSFVASGNPHFYTQTFDAGDIKETEGGWRLAFDLSNNPDTDDFHGTFRLFLNDILGESVANEWRGVLVSDITSTGSYEIFFNINNATFKQGGATVNWYAKKDGVIDPTITFEESHSVYSPTQANLSGKIQLWPQYQSSAGFRGAVSNFILQDMSMVLSGGTAGTWIFNGFNTTENDYIYWDSSGKLRFVNLPLIDPLSTDNPIQVINVSQVIDLPVKRYEKYKLVFEHGITSGNLSMYYFNNEGYGFRIPLIDTASPSPQEHIVEIGSEEWQATHPIDDDYAPEFKNRFVIRSTSGSAPVNGWIDNVSLTRVFNLDPIPTTVTFNEGAGGWTSFKSFIPESGISLSGSYFTFKDGNLYKHYTPLLDGAEVDSELANNYNSFYGINYNSKIISVMNNEPSIVKTFSTINYESNKTDTAPWICNDIETNIESGTINEFIKKEGKWFNYIKGKENTGSSGLDLSNFSIQGLGRCISVNTI